LADGENAEIELIDLNGKKILKKFALGNNVLLNLQEVDKGYYLINVITNRFTYPPHKLIVD
jgi:hypothetical protein